MCKGRRKARAAPDTHRYAANSHMEVNLENYIYAVRKALEEKNWYAALFISLSLPDICGSIQYPNKRSGERYREWFEKYLANTYKSKFTSSECWLLRCSCFHQGRDDNERTTNDGIVFLAPKEGAYFHLHRIRLQKEWTRESIVLQVDVFCEHLCQGVETWLKETKGIDDINKKLKMLLRIEEIKIQDNNVTIPIPVRINKY